MTPIPVLPDRRNFITNNGDTPRDAKLWDAANQLEATFLSEMLKSAGLGALRDNFGGGIGEEQFSSFLRENQAKQMTSAGGIGLAQALFEAMKVRADAII